MLQVWFKPFKSDVTPIIDSFGLFTLVVNYIVAWYYMTPTMDSLEKAAIVCAVEIWLVFLIFLVIFVFNVLKTKWQHLVVNYFIRHLKRLRRLVVVPPEEGCLRTLGGTADPYYRSCAHYREPILSGGGDVYN